MLIWAYHFFAKKTEDGLETEDISSKDGYWKL